MCATRDACEFLTSLHLKQLCDLEHILVHTCWHDTQPSPTPIAGMIAVQVLSNTGFSAPLPGMGALPGMGGLPGAPGMGTIPGMAGMSGMHAAAQTRLDSRP